MTGPVDRPGTADGQPLTAPGERQPPVRLHDQVEMVGLHREVEHPKEGLAGPGQSPTNLPEHNRRTQRCKSRVSPQRDVDRMAGLVVRTGGVGGRGPGPRALAASAATEAAPGAGHGQGELPGATGCHVDSQFSATRGGSCVLGAGMKGGDEAGGGRSFVAESSSSRSFVAESSCGPRRQHGSFPATNALQSRAAQGLIGQQPRAQVRTRNLIRQQTPGRQPSELVGNNPLPRGKSTQLDSATKRPREVAAELAVGGHVVRGEASGGGARLCCRIKFGDHADRVA
jgi:hypothetical protein